MKPILLTLLLVLTVLLTGCSQQSDTGNMPDVLKIGLLPDQDKAALEKRYHPLLSYISEQLKVPHRLIIADSYADLLKQFDDKKIDLAYFGGFAFTQAAHQSSAIPLVMRDIDINFTSYFFIRADASNTNTLKNIENFKNKRLAFGSKLSTSGHLMPRFFMQKMNINAESFFSNVMYAGAHDKTAYWVRDGKADIGAANSIIIDKMFTDGRLKKSDIKIIWHSPPYPDYVWAIQPSIGETVRNKISDAFLSLSPANKDHAVILSALDTGGFLPAYSSEFTQLHEIAHQIGLLDKILVHHK